VGFRFYRRVHLCPGVSVNLSGSGPSLSVGVRGAHVTLGRRGVTKTVGIPGTGLFYTSRAGFHSGYHSAVSDARRTPEEHAQAASHVEAVLALVWVAFIVGLVIASQWRR